jgi:hypothetical protein
MWNEHDGSYLRDFHIWHKENHKPLTIIIVINYYHSDNFKTIYKWSERVYLSMLTDFSQPSTELLKLIFSIASVHFQKSYAFPVNLIPWMLMMSMRKLKNHGNLTKWMYYVFLVIAKTLEIFYAPSVFFPKTGPARNMNCLKWPS